MSDKETKSANTVPGSMAQVFVTVKYTLLDYFRARRFAILLIIVLIISALLTVLVAHFRPASSARLATRLLLSVVGLLLHLPGRPLWRIHRRRCYCRGVPEQDWVLHDPEPRQEVLDLRGEVPRRLRGVDRSSCWSISAIAVVNGLYYFGANLPYQLGESFLFAWFYLLAVLGFTFMFSSLFKTSSYSILVSAILFLFAFTIIQTLVEDLAQIEPWFILTYGSGIIGNVLSPTYPAHTTTILGPGGRLLLTTYNTTIPEGLAIIAVYFIVTAVLGLLLFERKEFN